VACVNVAPVGSWKIVARWSVPNDRCPDVPAATGCALPNNGWFAFSPTTITDAQTRKNFVAFVVTAKSQGSSVILVYDDAGGRCDPFGYPAPYQIIVSQ